MLVELQIENFALIDSVQLEFREGLNVLTGETGAGKSIVLDALGFLLGDPARGDWSYWVLTGLADLRSPSMLYPPAGEGGLQVFDTVQPAGTIGVRRSADGRPLLVPLTVPAHW